MAKEWTWSKNTFSQHRISTTNEYTLLKSRDTHPEKSWDDNTEYSLKRHTYMTCYKNYTLTSHGFIGDDMFI